GDFAGGKRKQSVHSGRGVGHAAFPAELLGGAIQEGTGEFGFADVNAEHGNSPRERLPPHTCGPWDVLTPSGEGNRIPHRRWEPRGGILHKAVPEGRQVRETLPIASHLGDSIQVRRFPAPGGRRYAPGAGKRRIALK